MPLFYQPPNDYIIKGPLDEIFGGSRATFSREEDAIAFARDVSSRKSHISCPVNLYHRGFFRNQLMATFENGKQKHTCSCKCFHKDK